MNLRAIAISIVLAAALPLLGSAAPAVAGEPSSIAACARVAPVPPCNLWASRLPTGPGNEVHVAVNPLDPLHLLVVAKDYSLGVNSDCRPSGAFHVGSASYVTFDGGLSWSVTRVPAPYPNGGAEPSPLPYKCGSDPVAMFGPDGTAYYVLLNFQYAGGRQGAIAVARSPDGGRSWPASDIRVLHSSSGDDKEWGAVSADGRLHIVWTDVSNGRIYYARTLASYDAWQVKQIATAGGGNPAVVVATGPASEVYVFWRDSTSIKFTKSLDGGATFATIRTAFTTVPFETSAAPRLPFMPQVAVDQSPTSPYSGSIYVVWPDLTSGAGDPYLRFSRDGGATWSAVVRVEEDPRLQALVTVGVAPNGRVDVAWMDRTGNDLFTTSLASSVDGGVSFGAPRLVSEVPLYAPWSRHQDGSVFIGDYIGLASTNAYAYPSYSGNGPERVEALGATKFGRADAYVAPVSGGAPGPMADAFSMWSAHASVEVGDVPEAPFDPFAFMD